MVLDSQHSREKESGYEKTFTALRKFFAAFFENKRIMNVMSYAVVSRLPQQINNYDCGLMTCLNLRTLSEVEAAVEDIDYNVNGENFSQKQRMILAYELL